MLNHPMPCGIPSPTGAQDTLDEMQMERYRAGQGNSERVIPAQAGTRFVYLDSGFRRSDEQVRIQGFLRRHWHAETCQAAGRAKA